MGLRLPKQLPRLSGWVLTLYRYGFPILFMVGLFSVSYASPAATNRNTQFHTWPIADRPLSVSFRLNAAGREKSNTLSRPRSSRSLIKTRREVPAVSRRLISVRNLRWAVSVAEETFATARR